MTTVHPEYFPYPDKPGGLWRWSNDKRSISAHTLRELSAKLGPDWRIEGWWPDGFIAPKWPKVDKAIATRTTLPPSVQPKKFFNPAAVRAPVAKDHEMVLNLWRDGINSSIIGIRCGNLSRGTVHGIIYRARKRGDVRAMKRGRGGVR